MKLMPDQASEKFKFPGFRPLKVIFSSRKQTWHSPAKTDPRQTMMRPPYAIALNTGTTAFSGNSFGT